MKHKHIMFDLETVGTTAGSVITSIAAVAFDIETGETFDEFKMNISLKDSMKQGLKMDSDTILWWMEQSEEARTLFIKGANGGTTLKFVLSCLYDWIGTVSDRLKVNVWGRGPRFEFGLLGAAFNTVGIEIPWNFRNELCVRTMEFLAPGIKKNTKFEGIQHNAIDDAKHQIKYVSAIYKLTNVYE